MYDHPAMELKLRRAEPGEDYEAVARVRSICNRQNLTAVDLMALDGSSTPGTHLLRLVGELDRKVVATGYAAHSLWHRPGLFKLEVCIEPEYRRSSFGTRMLRHLESFAFSEGGTEFESRVRESELGGVKFLQYHGYGKIATSFESVLELKSFDCKRFTVAAAATPLRYFAFGDTEMGDREKKKLWELNSVSSADEPLNDPNFRPSFEEFNQGVIGASWFDPFGQFIAADGDDWIGMCAVARPYPPEFSNAFTGVLRSHRGRGIAKALKVRALDYAKKQGGEHIRTNNDSRNAPMLAINRSLGYQPEPGWIVTRKSSL